jgi:hypothetical protein
VADANRQLEDMAASLHSGARAGRPTARAS